MLHSAKEMMGISISAFRYAALLKQSVKTVAWPVWSGCVLTETNHLRGKKSSMP